MFCLRFFPYATDSTHLLNNVDLSQEQELELKKLNWDLETIAKSTLYFYLVTNMDGRKQSNRPIFTWYEWTAITFLILNKHTSKSVCSLLKLIYPCPNAVAVVGVKSALETFSLFSRLQISQESLNNLLIFF